MRSTLSRIKTFYCVIFFLANNTSQTKHKLMHNAKFLRKIRYFVTTSFKSRFMFFVLRKLLGPKTVAPIFSRQIQYLALARNVPLAFRKYHEISKNLLLYCLIFASGRDTQQNNLSHLTIELVSFHYCYAAIIYSPPGPIPSHPGVTLL